MYLLLAPLISMIVWLFNAIWLKIWYFAIFILPYLAAKLLALFGIGMLGFTGLDLAIDAIQAHIIGTYDGLPSDLLQMLNIMGLLTGIKILFGAMSGVISLKLLAAATKFTINQRTG
jgi:hypothetical protein